MEKYFYLLHIILTSYISFCPIIGTNCPDTQSRHSTFYKLIQRNARSVEVSVITRRWFAKVDHCKDFAESKQALAFNFGKRIHAILVYFKKRYFRYTFKNITY